MRSLPSLLPFALILAACGDDGNADTSGAATSGLTSASASASGSAGRSTSGSASGSSGAARAAAEQQRRRDGGEHGRGGLAVCGDGVVEGDEACDDGAANADDVADACRTDCSAPRCGDGVIDPGHGEVCDPMALAPGESCSVECDARRERFELGPRRSPTTSSATPTTASTWSGRRATARPRGSTTGGSSTARW
ncbi:MAG: hypothetical protein H6711_25230 [Myxococcales bacterium]|nr:hypothetical protein [Myxococcales bacterium]